MCIICECNGDYSSLKGVQTLNCEGCSNLTSIPVIEGLQTLNCRDCTTLTSIPVIEGLQTLYCRDCSNLTSIPVIKGLQLLGCGNCPSITSIPVIKGLKSLYCYYCPNLTSIPVIGGLKLLNCHYCPKLTSIPVKGLRNLDYGGCKYIHPTNKSVDYIRVLQQRIKCVILYKKLKRMVTCRQFVELWYHPESKGGYFTKQKAIKEMEDVMDC
jgi:hypothetical protein